MRLYTRSGDDGTTGLFGPQRVSKHHPRVECYGTIDELNAFIGLGLAAMTDPALAASQQISQPLTRMHEILSSIQSRLFDLGADLATPHDSPQRSRIKPLAADQISQIEQWIDEIDGGNQPLAAFVLPGGSELAARLHVARTICRRAERLLVGLRETEVINPLAIIYINRLSDLLFAMARRANGALGIADVPWKPHST